MATLRYGRSPYGPSLHPASSSVQAPPRLHHTDAAPNRASAPEGTSCRWRRRAGRRLNDGKKSLANHCGASRWYAQKQQEQQQQRHKSARHLLPARAALILPALSAPLSCASYSARGLKSAWTTTFARDLRWTCRNARRGSTQTPRYPFMSLRLILSWHSFGPSPVAAPQQ